MSLVRTLALAAIRGYKRHLSPRKGFSCAYRVHAGCASCSTLGLRAISRYGAWRGLGVLRLRLAECHRVAEAQRVRRARPTLAQAGFIDCDLPCDASCVSCDLCSMGDACEILSCLDCADCGDWGSAKDSPARQARRRRRGEPVVLEPGPGKPLSRRY